jgi:predicted dehydrogenase
MAEPLRWGILGTGRITPRLVGPLTGSPRHGVVAVASRDGERAAAYAAEHGLPRTHSSYEALLADSGVDAIYVALPNHLHVEWTVRALEAGKHVLCEKPLGLSVEEVDRVIAASEATGRVAVEAFMYLHHPQTKQALSLIGDGRIGEVQLIRGAFSFVLTHPGDPRLEPTMGGGSLWDVGGYPISLANRIAGDRPAEVAATARVGPSGVDLRASALLRYESGVVAQIFSSFETPHREWVEVVGTEATLVLEPAFVPHLPGVDTTIAIRSEGDAVESITIPLSDPYLAEANNLADVIAGAAEPELPLAETRRNVATILDVYAAAARG